MTSRVYLYNLLLRALVYVLPMFAFVTASYLLFGGQFLSVAVRPPYLLLFGFTQIAWILASEYYKLSSIAELFWEYTGIRAAFVACLVTLLLQAALLLFFRQLVIARPFILISNAMMFHLVVAIRNFFRLTSASSSWPRKYEKILIVGTDRYAQKYVKLLRQIPFFRCEIQAYLQLPGQPVHVQDAPVVSAEQPLSLDGVSFDEVVVALPAWRYPQLPGLLDRLQDFGKPIRAIFDLGPRLSLRDKLFQAGQLQMMNLTVSPVESFAYTVVKKAFDLVAAIGGVLILSPVFGVVALLVRISSPGPVFFRQDRVGRHGRHFSLMKFRTMYCSSREESDTTWTTRNDPRCTPIGAMLRKFSLDELPQLFNVIRGDMSLVGPRPERPHFVAKFREDLEKYNLRHSCEVGITGWAQVNGLRGDTSISERLQYDLYYIHNWSLGMDLQIIFRTLVVALRDANGY